MVDRQQGTTARMLAILGCGSAMVGSHAMAQSPGDAALTALRDRVNRTLQLAASEITSAESRHVTGGLEVQLSLDGRPTRLVLTPAPVRAAGFRLIAHREDGTFVDVQPGPEQNYTGVVQGRPGTRVAATVTADGVSASIRLENRERMWMEPLRPRLAGMPEFERLVDREALHVVYRGNDVLGCVGTCGVTPEWEQRALELMADAGEPLTEAGGAGGLCVAQVACDADFEYFSDYGSVEAVEQRILSVINAANMQYIEEVGITHQVSAIIVRTAEQDPYTTTFANDLIDEERDFWNANHGGVTRDVVHLFTGKELDGSTIGLAFRFANAGVVCDLPWGYSLAQSDFSFLFSCTVDVTAHELGHNWNAVHCTGNCDSTMNATVTCANTFADSSPNTVTAITNWRDSVNCLDCGELLTRRLSVAGNASSQKLGKAVAVCDDVNGDGMADFLVGLPEDDQAGANAGKVQMRNGANGAVIWEKRGEAAGDKFGSAVAAFNGRVAVGAPFNDVAGGNAGRVYIYDATTGVRLKTKNGAAAGDRFGWSAAGGDDINNDGFEDFMIGAPYHNQPASDAGAVYVFNGDDYQQLRKLKGEAAGDRFGWSLAMLGLLNFDSNPDFIVGAPWNDNAGGVNAGKAYVYSGANFSKIGTKRGVSAGDQFGKSVAGPGRMNNDTRPDFAVGAPMVDVAGDSNVGRVYVYSALDFSLLWKASGAATGDQFGAALCGAGDVNGDGLDELAVGAPLNDTAANNAGRVQVRSGLNGAVLQSFNGENSGDQFGGALAGHGGLNASDRARIVVGAAFNDSGASNGGQATLIEGSPSGVAATWTPPPRRSCPGDLVGADGVVNQADVLALLDAWARCSIADGRADTDGGCGADPADLLMILSSWGACE
jgi:hypothetical protein